MCHFVLLFCDPLLHTSRIITDYATERSGIEPLGQEFAPIPSATVVGLGNCSKGGEAVPAGLMKGVSGVATGGLERI